MISKPILRSCYKGMAYFYSEYYPGRPTIVFLHDSLGCIRLWRDFPEKLGEQTGCNILVYDRLGYGESTAMVTSGRGLDYLEVEADFCFDLLCALGLKDVILFGHSDGGSIALLVASKYPMVIQAVIAEAAHIFVEELTLNGIHDSIIAYQHTDLPQRLAKYHGEKVDTIFKAWTETWTASTYRVWNMEHFLTSIECPLLFIQGEEDEYGTLAQLRKTVDQVSGYAEELILTGVGHTPHKAVPDLVLNKTAQFIHQLMTSLF